MVGPNDILIPAGTRWLVDPAAQALCRVIGNAGFEVLFVGGCVRNALLGLPDSDVDMSTNARPEKVMQIAGAAGFKAIPTGIDHGTVTVVVRGKPFEVTTYRRDVATDGRRAVVAFSDDIADDARRRDFTMNALYADPAGRVLDPLGGLADLQARRIRFIEDPQARIREDYLRILRFFRFSAWYGQPEAGFDTEALAAIATNLEGLESLSAERVGQEMVKLLTAVDPAPAVAAMRQTGVLNVILPGADDRLLPVIVHIEIEMGLNPDPIPRLAALGGEGVVERLRLSRAEAKALSLLQEVGFTGPMLHEVAYRHGAEIATGAMLLRAALAETVPAAADFAEIEQAAQAVFPIKAADLMPELQGPELGARLKTLERAWIRTKFTLSAEELLALPDGSTN